MKLFFRYVKLYLFLLNCLLNFLKIYTGPPSEPKKCSLRIIKKHSAKHGSFYFNATQVYEFVNKFRLPFNTHTLRCNLNNKLAGIKKENNKHGSFNLTIIEEYDREHFLVPLGEEERISS